jgi:hypothetical protein
MSDHRRQLANLMVEGDSRRFVPVHLTFVGEQRMHHQYRTQNITNNTQTRQKVVVHSHMIILTTEPSRLKFLASLLSLSAHKVPLSLLLRQLPSRTVSNPLYFFSCCAALAVSFCRSWIDLFASLWSPRSALTALSLSLARPSCHCPLPSFCSFSCCCFSFSASSGRASLSARAKRTLVMRTVV